MSLKIRLRAIFTPLKLLNGAGFKKEDSVLDFGCGPGVYSFAAAQLASDKGVVYAMDIVEDAVEEIRKRIEKKRIKHVVPIHSGLDTGLLDESIDVILVYNVFHHIENPDDVLKELHRVLKPSGVVSFYDKHMDENEIKEIIQKKGYFAYKEMKHKTTAFIKKNA